MIIARITYMAPVLFSSAMDFGVVFGEAILGAAREVTARLLTHPAVLRAMRLIVHLQVSFRCGPITANLKN